MHHESECDHTNCSTKSANQSVCQTLSEMNWERGLWNAAFSGETQRVKDLIDKSKNAKEAVNSPDNSGYSPLHYAARNGHVDICKLLLLHDADINATTRSGKATPLHKAAAAGKVSTVKFLTQSGACMELQDIDGKTALHKAVDFKHSAVIDLLLEICPQLNSIKDLKGKLAIE